MNGKKVNLSRYRPWRPSGIWIQGFTREGDRMSSSKLRPSLQYFQKSSGNHLKEVEWTPEPICTRCILLVSETWSIILREEHKLI